MTPPLIQSDKWTWQQAEIHPPLNVLAGDVITEVAGQLLVTRNGFVVETRSIGTLATVAAVATGPSTIRSVVFLKVKVMPGQNVVCTRVFESGNGAINFTFSSGTSLELASWADAGVIADQMDASPDIAEKMLIGKAFRADPTGANKTTQVGASFSVNLEADVPAVYTEPL